MVEEDEMASEPRHKSSMRARDHLTLELIPALWGKWTEALRGWGKWTEMHELETQKRATQSLRLRCRNFRRHGLRIVANSSQSLALESRE